MRVWDEDNGDRWDATEGLTMWAIFMQGGEVYATFETAAAMQDFFGRYGLAAEGCYCGEFDPAE